MTEMLKSMTIVCMAACFVMLGCGKQEQEQKTEPAADYASQKAVRETDEKQVDEGREAAAEEATAAEAVSVPEVSKSEAIGENTVSPTASQESAPSEETATPEEKTTDAQGTDKKNGFTYVGAKKCKVCHLKQYKSWESSSMAKSFENLSPGVNAGAKKKAGLDPEKDYTRDEVCQRCHTTGYGKPGGFVSLEATPDMINVQCEACHGPGSEYCTLMKENKEYLLAEAKAAGLVIPSEDREGCLRCHGDDNPFNESVDPKYKFDFARMLERSHEHFPLKRQH